MAFAPQLEQLESWLKSCRPEELFDQGGRFLDELAALAPTGQRRMGCNPHANGGALLKPLAMPPFRAYAVAVPELGAVAAEATRVRGKFVRDVMLLNNPDRYQLALDAIRRIARQADKVDAETARFGATLQRHERHIGEHGDDMPELLNWRWTL